MFRKISDAVRERRRIQEDQFRRPVPDAGDQLDKIAKEDPYGLRSHKK